MPDPDVASEQMHDRTFAPLNDMFGVANWRGKIVARHVFFGKNIIKVHRVLLADNSGAKTSPVGWYYLSLAWGNAPDIRGGAPINSRERAMQRFEDLKTEMVSYVVAPADLPEDLLDG